MTRQELRNLIENNLIQFEYQCKIKRKNHHKRYVYRINDASWFLLVVNYKENSASLSRHWYWPNERIESKFDYLYVHDLNEDDFRRIIRMFTN